MIQGGLLVSLGMKKNKKSVRIGVIEDQKREKNQKSRYQAELFCAENDLHRTN